ncbi:hypothetical protein CN285_14665 [Bacillus cereus]|uniref:hypothetical protein n=1 Tax=Bacillus paramycoides TaxID=2026194 RepID=UPI000BF9208F|nr:hypothetical protein [Bacillus paramycoides]PFD40191.1 hypothetical protein CN285_14665 [Bacillus cereus]PGM58231.1 hypothetical protein CN947_22410 [Bacillus cereus]
MGEWQGNTQSTFTNQQGGKSVGKVLDENIVEKIIKLRFTGMSTNMIARKLDISRATVRYRCTKHDLGGGIAHNPFVDEACDRFITGFNKRHGNRFIYVSGF